MLIFNWFISGFGVVEQYLLLVLTDSRSFSLINKDLLSVCINSDV